MEILKAAYCHQLLISCLLSLTGQVSQLIAFEDNSPKLTPYYAEDPYRQDWEQQFSPRNPNPEKGISLTFPLNETTDDHPPSHYIHEVSPDRPLSSPPESSSYREERSYCPPSSTEETPSWHGQAYDQSPPTLASYQSTHPTECIGSEWENFTTFETMSPPSPPAINESSYTEPSPEINNEPSLGLSQGRSNTRVVKPSETYPQNYIGAIDISKYSDESDSSDLIAQTTPPNLPTNSPPAPPPTPSPVIQQPSPPVQPTSPRPPTMITPHSPTTPSTPTASTVTNSQGLKEISSINFNNVAMIEYIRFISRISNKNFIFDDADLQFNVTIVSAESTSIENLMTALLQELNIRELSLIEQGNNILIHRNPKVRAPGRVVDAGTELVSSRESEIVTRVFRLNTLDPVKASEIIRPLLSEQALVGVLRDTNNLVITDLVPNVNKIAHLIDTLDAPNSGVTIGQYIVRNAFVDSLVDLATKLLQPIAQGNPLVLVPHTAKNSIFIVSNPFIVEKALAILEHLDLNEGRTRMVSLEDLKPNMAGAAGITEGPSEKPLIGGLGTTGQMDVTDGRFNPVFDESRDFMPGGVSSDSRWSQDLPTGHIERTLFFIYKLRYRRGDQIEVALRKIAASLQLTGTANVELISTINSSQWIESSNALIFTGTSAALDKIRELILEIDTPLRQVFIEMLILETTITDSLSYGVDWVTRFGGGPTSGIQNFNGSAFQVSETDTTAIEEVTDFATDVLSPSNLINFLTGGYSASIIGTHITHGGTRFNTITALVQALHNDSKTNILMNPKIVTEDNNTAEIFVGGTDRYKTQSITNDLGTLVTNNFQFIDVGTTLRVTPLISNNGIITLDIIQETTRGEFTANATSANQSVVDVNLVPVLTKTRSVTKVHVPNGFFVVMSGMIQDFEARTVSRIPCLGGIPILGGLAKNQSNADNKRNLMIFIRPLIIDTEEDLENITRRQQDVYREKSKFRRAWNYEIDEGLNFLNVKPTDPDEIGCNQR